MVAMAALLPLLMAAGGAAGNYWANKPEEPIQDPEDFVLGQKLNPGYIVPGGPEGGRLLPGILGLNQNARAENRRQKKELVGDIAGVASGGLGAFGGSDPLGTAGGATGNPAAVSAKASAPIGIGQSGGWEQYMQGALGMMKF